VELHFPLSGCCPQSWTPLIPLACPRKVLQESASLFLFRKTMTSLFPGAHFLSAPPVFFFRFGKQVPNTSPWSAFGSLHMPFFKLGIVQKRSCFPRQPVFFCQRNTCPGGELHPLSYPPPDPPPPFLFSVCLLFPFSNYIAGELFYGRRHVTHMPRQN